MRAHCESAAKDGARAHAPDAPAAPVAGALDAAAAGFEVPLAAFMGVRVGWRVLAIALQLCRRRGRTHAAAKARRLLAEDAAPAAADPPRGSVSPNAI